jgi:hypothetical protein
MVDAEYGNQGLDFKLVPREGFGWTNSSFQLGLMFLTTGMRRAVAACTPVRVVRPLPFSLLCIRSPRCKANWDFSFTPQPDVYFRLQRPRSGSVADIEATLNKVAI